MPNSKKNIGKVSIVRRLSSGAVRILPGANRSGGASPAALPAGRGPSIDSCRRRPGSCDV
jgi:hypothetical protein